MSAPSPHPIRVDSVRAAQAERLYQLLGQWRAVKLTEVSHRAADDLCRAGRCTIIVQRETAWLVRTEDAERLCAGLESVKR